MEQFEPIDSSSIILSDQHPSFFVISMESKQYITTGWIDLPDFRWRFNSPSDELFFTTSARGIVAAMAGKLNNAETIKELADLIKQILVSMIKSKKIILRTPTFYPECTVAEGINLMRLYLSRHYLPGTPEIVFKRHFGSPGAEEIIEKLKEASIIEGVMWLGEMKIYIPSENKL